MVLLIVGLPQLVHLFLVLSGELLELQDLRLVLLRGAPGLSAVAPVGAGGLAARRGGLRGPTPQVQGVLSVVSVSRLFAHFGVAIVGPLA